MKQDENKLVEQKAALLSMKTAHQNMTKIIKRVEDLESALNRSANDLKSASELVMGYQYNSQEKYSVYFQKCERSARDALIGKF